jgi:hypothetical protein
LDLTGRKLTMENFKDWQDLEEQQTDELERLLNGDD